MATVEISKEVTLLFSLRDIMKNYQLISEYQEFGEIRTFLIDTAVWRLRYLVVRVGSRDVLLSHHALNRPDARTKTFSLSISREKIMNSPNINLNRRISRELEKQIYDYYQWPYDWEEGEVPESLPGDLTAVPLIEMEIDREDQLVPQTGEDRPYSSIYDVHDLFGYTIYTENDEEKAGQLSDLIGNDENWRIMFMILNVGNALSNRKKAALAPTWVQMVDEAKQRFIVDLQEDTIDDLPAYQTIEDLNSRLNS